MLERPGYRFCQSLIELNTQLNPIITDAKFVPPKSSLFSRNKVVDQLNNEMSSITAGFVQLVNSFSALNPRMDTEETERKHFPVDKDLDDAIQEGEEHVAVLKAEFNTLTLEYEEKKREMTTEQEVVSEQIEAKDDQTTVAVIEATAEESTYNTDIARLQVDRTNAQEKLDQACCSCFPCSAKKEKAAVKRIEDQIAALEAKELERKKTAAEHKPSHAIVKLETEAERLKKQRKKLIQSYPAHILEAKTAFDAEEKELQGNKVRMQNSRNRYFSQISPDNVAYYVRAYACMIELTRLVTQAYSTKYNLMQGRVGPTDTLNTLKAKLAENKLRLDIQLDHLWYNSGHGRTVRETYNNFLTLPDPERTAFLQGKLTRELIQKIIAPLPPTADAKYAPATAARTEPALPLAPPDLAPPRTALTLTVHH